MTADLGLRVRRLLTKILTAADRRERRLRTRAARRDAARQAHTHQRRQHFTLNRRIR